MYFLLVSEMLYIISRDASSGLVFGACRRIHTYGSVEPLPCSKLYSLSKCIFMQVRMISRNIRKAVRQHINFFNEKMHEIPM